MYSNEQKNDIGALLSSLSAGDVVCHLEQCVALAVNKVPQNFFSFIFFLTIAFFSFFPSFSYFPFSFLLLLFPIKTRVT